VKAITSQALKPRLWTLLGLCLLLAACGSAPKYGGRDGVSSRLPPPKDIANIPDPVPRAEPLSSYGNPQSYVVFGRRYHTLKQARGYSERGIASWYGSKFHGRRTSSGEPYDMYAMTAAHKSLPLPSYARVTNLRNNRSVIVRVNDRGPFHDNRLIDLSYTAAWKLGIIGEGTGLVEVAAIDPNAPKNVPEPEVAEPETGEKVAPPAKRSLPELFLQVGAFGNESNAGRLKQRLEKQLQVDVLIQESTAQAAPVYRVQVGPIASVELADHLTLQLAQLGISDPHVVIR
jgi:rare lipoprotein A